MGNRRSIRIPLDWDPETVRLLSLIAPSDPDEARRWWIDYAPAAYAVLMDAPHIAIPEYINDREELAEYLSNLDVEGERRSRLQAAGLLLFFIGGSYWRQDGRQIAWRGIKNALDRAVYRMSNRTTSSLCEQLRDGSVTLEQWQAEMASTLKSIHLISGITAAGGIDGLTPALRSRIEAEVENQLSYLAAFASRIASGLPMDGNICRLMNMYLRSGRQSYYAVEAELALEGGFTEYRNLLGATEDHCTGSGSCLEESAKGWVPLGQLSPIGSRNCLSNCLCQFEYRKVAGIDGNGFPVYEYYRR